MTLGKRKRKNNIVKKYAALVKEYGDPVWEALNKKGFFDLPLGFQLQVMDALRYQVYMRVIMERVEMDFPCKHDIAEELAEAEEEIEAQSIVSPRGYVH